ncbi:TnsA-like heteromeric transposase endonuclease subunit [Streptomyces sp. NPDC058691]|uniref:TnsA-like heteromeric transposase endonuclease subunit n=1 Tax=Streptomyces sp. NPDC058691 TaxID=3346601 RepID=UPI00365C5B28
MIDDNSAAGVPAAPAPWRARSSIARSTGHKGAGGGGLGVEAVFRDPAGNLAQQRWVDAAVTVALEDLEPVSAFPVVPGRRWGPGLWWSATTGRHVSCGSSAMRAQLMVLDRDPEVVGLAGRPVRLIWRDRRGQVRAWVPQLLARYADGSALLADCPGHPEAGGERARQAAVAMAEACAQVGFTYRRLHRLDETPAANLKWLAGYRHPRNAGRPGLLAAVLEAFARPRPLIEGVEAAGDPIEVLPVAFHALWRGLLSAPLDTPLHERVWVSAASYPRSGEHIAGSSRSGSPHDHAHRRTNNDTDADSSEGSSGFGGAGERGAANGATGSPARAARRQAAEHGTGAV